MEKDVEYAGWRKIVNRDEDMEKELFNLSLPSSWESWKLYLQSMKKYPGKPVASEITDVW